MKGPAEEHAMTIHPDTTIHPDAAGPHHGPDAAPCLLSWNPLPGLHFEVAQVESALQQLLHAVMAKDITIDEGLRLFDALQLFLFGPYADTNFSWTECTPAHIARALAAVESQGFTGQQAVVAGWNEKGASTTSLLGYATGSEDNGATWSVHIPWATMDGQPCTFTLPGTVANVHATSRMADMAFLALRGMVYPTSFPASQYTAEDLRIIGAAVVIQGADPEAVEGHLQAIEAVRGFYRGLLAATLADGALADAHTPHDSRFSTLMYSDKCISCSLHASSTNMRRAPTTFLHMSGLRLIVTYNNSLIAIVAATKNGD
jgi:hypothetical protein